MELARVFDAHAAALLLYARQWVDAAEAEDVVQCVFLRLVAGGRVPAEEPRTWLFRCVRNEAVSAARSARRRERRHRAVGGEAWFVPRPEDVIDAKTAEEALRTLPLQQREVVTLRIWSGLTLAEIAAVMGIAVSTLHGQYNAALTALRKRLENPCPKKT
jgi:RNA polymerase sigma factor (sigma-70 family)